MYPNQVLFLIVIFLLGIPVILSYVLGLRKPEEQNLLWGGVPTKYRKAYTISMIVSAISYFVFTTYVIILLGQFNGNGSYPFFYILYIIMLAASALWVPLVKRVANKNTLLNWYLVRFVLALNGFAAFMLFFFLANLSTPSIFYYISIVLLGIYTLHTAILDAIIWPYFWKSKKA